MVATLEKIDKLEREGVLSGQDANEVRSFARFLSVIGAPGERDIRREIPGWLPYCLGMGPPPPPEMDAVPWTAWTMPS